MILSLNNNNKKNHKHLKLQQHETWCMTNACCTNLPGNLIPFIFSEPPIIQCWVMHKTCRAGARLAAVLWAPPITRIEHQIGGFVKIRPFKIRPGAVQWARQVRPEERNGKLWRALVGLTLASVGCVEPGAIPGAHRGVYTRHSGRVELREFAALLEIEEFVVCVTQKASLPVQWLPAIRHWNELEMQISHVKNTFEYRFQLLCLSVWELADHVPCLLFQLESQKPIGLHKMCLRALKRYWLTWLVNRHYCNMWGNLQSK